MNNYCFVAAHPRSGSTYLCRLLGEFKQLDVYLEIFHTNMGIIKQHLKNSYPDVIQKLELSGSDELIRKLIVGRNKRYLKVLSDLNPDKCQVFKVFSGHLPNSCLESIIENTQFIVLLRRNLLHSYLSDVIATHTQKWARVDTSALFARFSEEEFISHIKRVLSFYEIIEEFAKCSSKHIVCIRYENLITADNPYTYIADLLKDHFQLANCNADKIFSKTLQDKRVMAIDKVKNPNEMHTFLDSVGLSMLNNGKSYCSDKQYLNAIKRYEEFKNIRRITS